ncbi:hypothetical protein JW992_05720 [candidate division KSB1 bacterium]|nr:hypothetical protein [candidate division KSB1 bacterium]
MPEILQPDKPLTVLGINDITGNHTLSTIALWHHENLVYALSQERVSGIKNDHRFPRQAILLALDASGLTLQDVDIFACAYPPARYYSALFSNQWNDPLRSLWGVVKHKPGRLLRTVLPNLRKSLLDSRLRNGLHEMGVAPNRIRYVDHHRAHVAAAWSAAPFDRCLGISYGGFAPHADGRNCAGAVYICKDDHLIPLLDIPMPATGCFLSALTVTLGYRYMQDEGKTAALAALGNPQTCRHAIEPLMTRYHTHWQAAPHWVDFLYAPQAQVFLASTTGRALMDLLSRYTPQDVAAAALDIWRENLFAFFLNLVQSTGINRILCAGGIFADCRINSALHSLPQIKKLYVHPAPGDASTALGAIFESLADLQQKRVHLPLSDLGLGGEATIDEIGSIVAANDALETEQPADIPAYAAEQAARGRIVGWFHGREDFGPHSLAHRSILGDPRRADLVAIINGEIKNRESFLPLAVSCLAEYGNDFFKDFFPCPEMNFVFPVRSDIRRRIPAAVFCDGQTRVGAVTAESYAPFRQLLQEYHRRTGIPMLLNSSLNRHGEPIISTPAHAIDLLIKTPMDLLVLNRIIVRKKVNPFPPQLRG